MSLRIDKRCKVCQLVRTDKKLLKRLYQSRAYIPQGEPLKGIALEYPDVSYRAFHNHCHKHQGIDADDLENRRMHKKAKAIEAKQLRDVMSHIDARNELVDLGLAQLRDGKISMTSGTIASLLKQQSDIEEKQKDRQLEVLKMVQKFQSGENKYLEEETPWQRPQLQP